MWRKPEREPMIGQKKYVISRISLAFSLRSAPYAQSLLLTLSALAFAQWDYRSALAADDLLLERKRPLLNADRSQEDWSSLADPKVRTEPLDSFKYIPLFPANPDSYISLGLNLREIFEVSDAPAFGTVRANPRDSYGLQRAQFHIDAHLNKNWQLFTQFEDVRAFDKTAIGPNDANRFDLRQAFIGYTQETDAGTFRARVGRQDFAFDLERFVSTRDGPNVRQSFDAVWAGWETDAWRFYGLVSQPVQYRDDDPFDDRSSRDATFSGARVERQLSPDIEASAYYALYRRQDANFLSASGEEERHVFDIRSAGNYAGFDWDAEAMGQVGKVGSADILAWAVGARTGYTFEDLTWSPRIGLQFDVASGDRDAADGTLGTFNPLFPNGFYFSLGGHTGYANLVHIKPSLTVQPAEDLILMAGVGLLWRQTTEDAIYSLPSVPVAGTADEGSAWTGAYMQVRADYRFNPNFTGSLEAVHYQVGSALEAMGGRDSNYFRAELKLVW
ncbi:conserved hypothetical protein; putative signal peptide [Agrobacterium fabrum str. J-07]|nr:conserved hypothetical protein; putative signal peptide [Agrobacterium fabrum str. J-07]